MDTVKIGRAYGRVQRLLEAVEATRKDTAGERSSWARTMNAGATQVELAARAMEHACDEASPSKGKAWRSSPNYIIEAARAYWRKAPEGANGHEMWLTGADAVYATLLNRARDHRISGMHDEVKSVVDYAIRAGEETLRRELAGEAA